jgi:hypothetical protein
MPAALVARILVSNWEPGLRPLKTFELTFD